MTRALLILMLLAPLMTETMRPVAQRALECDGWKGYFTDCEKKPECLLPYNWIKANVKEENMEKCVKGDANGKTFTFNLQEENACAFPLWQAAMKNAAKCDTQCELQNTASHEIF